MCMYVITMHVCYLVASYSCVAMYVCILYFSGKEEWPWPKHNHQSII